MNNQNNMTYEHGYVVLPVEEHTKLMQELYELRGMVSLTETYNGQVAVQFNKVTIHKLAKQLYEASEYNTPERELKSLISFNVWTADLTDKVESADEDEESADEDEESAAEG